MSHAEALVRRGRDASTSRRRPFAVVAAIVFLGFLAGCSAPQDNPWVQRDLYENNREFDTIQAAYEQDPGAFASAVDYMERLKVAHPEADMIYWSGESLCVTDMGGSETCALDDSGREWMDRLPTNTNGLLYQSKDDGRVFFFFNAPEPPVVYAMYAPDDEHPGLLGLARFPHLSRTRRRLDPSRGDRRSRRRPRPVSSSEVPGHYVAAPIGTPLEW